MKLFLVIDFQKGHADRILGADEALTLDGRVSKRIHDCRYDGTDVAFTVDSRLGRELSGRCAKQKLMCDMVFEKSILPSVDLYEYLKQKEYSSVELCGAMLYGAVLANAILVRAALPKTEIIVDEALTASDDDDLGREALEAMEAMRIRVIRR